MIKTKKMKPLKNFYKGLEVITDEESFNAEKRVLNERVFSRIFSETEKGNMQWERKHKYKQILGSNIEVTAYSGEKMDMPVYLEVCIPDDYTLSESAFLYLGKIDSQACRNDADNRVRKLAENLGLYDKKWANKFSR